MEYFNNIEDAQAAFDEYYAQAFSDVRDRIVLHFKGDDWTNEQIELIMGELISAEWLNHYLPLYERVDDEIRNSEDFDLQTLISYAKEFGIDLTGLDIPYKMIILKDGDNLTSLDDYDKVEDLLHNEELIEDNLDRYVVCQNRNDLAAAWEDNLQEYEGAWYGIKDGSGLIIGGTYDPNDISDIAMLPDYEKSPSLYEMTCRITGRVPLSDEHNRQINSAKTASEVKTLYNSVTEQAFKEANFGDCINVNRIAKLGIFADYKDSKCTLILSPELLVGQDAKYYIKTEGYYRCHVKASTLEEAKEKADSMLHNADFKSISGHSKKADDFVCTKISILKNKKTKENDIER